MSEPLFTADEQKKFDAGIAELLTHYPPERKLAAMLPALRLLQSLKTWLPPEGMQLVAQKLESTVEAAYEVATFRALREMLRTMHHGGSVAMLGIPAQETAIDWTEVIFKGITIKGIYGREMFETWYKMSSLLQSGLDITPVITHHFGINDYLEGFEIMASGKSGKVILDWSSL